MKYIKQHQCIFCQQMFMAYFPTTLACKTPECQEQLKRRKQQKKKEAQQRYRQAQKELNTLAKAKLRPLHPVIPGRRGHIERYCIICNMKIENQNWFYCEPCHLEKTKTLSEFYDVLLY